MGAGWTSFFTSEAKSEVAEQGWILVPSVVRGPPLQGHAYTVENAAAVGVANASRQQTLSELGSLGCAPGFTKARGPGAPVNGSCGLLADAGELPAFAMGVCAVLFPGQLEVYGMRDCYGVCVPRSECPLFSFSGCEEQTCLPYSGVRDGYYVRSERASGGPVSP
eukprot:COSAG05_NODE_8080_length_738_cov_1.170579_1_plen_165_part_00